jgi:hypothetical protein
VQPDTLHEIGVKSPHVAVHKKIADHPKTHANTLNFLARTSPASSGIHKIINNHLNAAPETKKYIADNNLL